MNGEIVCEMNKE